MERARTDAFAEQRRDFINSRAGHAAMTLDHSDRRRLLLCRVGHALTSQQKAPPLEALRLFAPPVGHRASSGQQADRRRVFGLTLNVVRRQI